jgi:polysaccharide pyruvyl transferase WcaK-like protein
MKPDSLQTVPRESPMKVLIVDYISEKNRGDAAIHMGLIDVLHRCYPNAILSAISVIGANQFPEMEHEYDQSNSLGIKVYGGLVPTFYPPSKKSKKPALLFELQNLISLFFRLWLLIALKLKMPARFLHHFVSKKYHLTLGLLNNADLIVIRGRNYRERKTATLEIVRMHSKIYHLLLCSLLSKKMVLIGASVWNQKSNLAEKMLAYAFKSCEFVTVRETCSFEAAKRIAYSYNFPEPLLIPDLSFASFEDRKEIIQNRAQLSTSDHPQIIGLTIHDWNAESRKTRNKYLVSLTRLMKYYATLGSRIIIVPQVSVTWEDSSKMIGELLVNVRMANVSIIEGDPTVQELLQLYSSLDLLVATRMHSAIFATAVNTPIVAIPYDKGGKWSIIEELGYGDYLINYDEITPEILIKKTVSCWKNKHALVIKAEDIVDKNTKNIQVLVEKIRACS